ncbi:MAG: hypothetical protein RQ741_05480 [Wenzhouxiangellaceae bacterium]|nr:hypothetical protein [Wenzhouxiangellaceae bacterium]
MALASQANIAHARYSIMPEARYLFQKASFPALVKSRGKVNDDALNALAKWLEDASNRRFEIVAEDEQLLRADLSWPSSDSKAAPDLDAYCEDHGIARVLQRRGASH